MGEPTGFLTWAREAPTRRPVPMGSQPVGQSGIGELPVSTQPVGSRQPVSGGRNGDPPW